MLIVAFTLILSIISYSQGLTHLIHPVAAQESIEKGVQDLLFKLDKFNKEVERQQKDLFSNRKKIKKLCAQDFKLPNHKERDEYFNAIAKDPVSNPRVDCIFIKTTDGSDALLSFKLLPKNTGYQMLKRYWFAPGGTLSIAKNPFHEIPRISDGSWRLNRVTLSPSNIFPINGMRNFILNESKPNIGTTISRVWVKKEFVILRKGKPIERLYLLVRDHGKVKIFGTEIRARSWYIYSELANVVLRKSILPRAKDAFGSLAGIGISGIIYMRNDKVIQWITKEEFGPVRKYLLKFDPWK